MDFWANLQIHKWQTAGWFLLYVISLALLFKNRNKWGKNICYMLIFTGMSVALFCFPLFAKIMVKTVLPSYLEYERMLWLLFAVPIVAFCGVNILSELDGKRQKTALVLMLLTGLFLSNTTIISRGFKLPDTFLKVPKDVVIISEAIIEDSGCNIKENSGFSNYSLVKDEDGNVIKPKVLVQEDSDGGKIGNWMVKGIRQYTSAPELSDIYIQADVYEAEDFNILDYDIMEYEYFVCNKSEILKASVEAVGFELLVDGKDYALYKNNKVFTAYLVRHAQTDANVAEVFAGSGTDAMLTGEGVAQATTTGEALEDINFENVFVSELTRTQDTAECITNQNNNICGNAQILAGLNDLYWGDLEGMSVEEVSTTYPGYTYDDFIGTASDTAFISPINAETKANLCLRLDNTMQKIAADSEENGNSLVVCHSSMIWWLQENFVEATEVGGLENASITVINYDRGKWSLDVINKTAAEYEEIIK